MADRSEACAVEEADCLWRPVGSERWSAWLEVTPSQRRHGGACGGSSGSRRWLSEHSYVERGGRLSASRAGETWHREEENDVWLL
jgi:hypothetical protein